MSLDPKDDFYTNIQLRNIIPDFQFDHEINIDKMKIKLDGPTEEKGKKLIRCNIIFDGRIQAFGEAFSKDQAEKNAAIIAMEKFFPSNYQ